MRKWLPLLLCFALLTPAYADEVIVDFDEASVPVLNEELRQLREKDVTISKYLNINGYLGTGTYLANVIAFGAIGDGVADDTAAIQLTIDAVYAVGGGVVYFPGGIYKIIAALTLKSNMIFRGEGWNSKIYQSGTSGEDCLYWSGSDGDRLTGCGIEDLWIAGNASSGRGIDLNFTAKRGTGKNWITRCKISDHGLSGIYWEDGDNLSITKNLISTNSRDGIELYNLTNKGTFFDNTIEFNRYGIYNNWVVSNTLIQGNSIHDNTDAGIYTYGSEAAQIRENVFNRNGASGSWNCAIIVQGANNKWNEATVIEGNLFGDNGGGSDGSEAGYELRIAAYTWACLIKENYFYGVDQDYFVKLADLTQGTVLEDNHWKNESELGTGILELGTPSGTGTLTYTWKRNADVDDTPANATLDNWDFHDKTLQFSKAGRGANPAMLQFRWAIGDTEPQWRVYTDGDMEWGDGTNAADVTLYRSAANILKTDNAFTTGGTVTAVGDVKMSKVASQGYMYVYNTGGDKYSRWYHNNTSPIFETTDGIHTFAGDLNIGVDTADKDYVLTFKGETYDGAITWLEDEARFSSDSDWIIAGTNEIFFQDTATKIHSADDGHLDLTADVSVDINGSLFTLANGNVGIGEATPSFRLHVEHGAESGAYLSGSTDTWSLKAINNVGLTTDDLLFARSNSVTTGTLLNAISSSTARTGGYLLDVLHDATSAGVNTGGIARFYSNDGETGTRRVVDIRNDNAAATGATALYVQHDAPNATWAEQIATAGYGLGIYGTQASSEILLYATSDTDTTGNIAKFRSNSPDTSTRNLVEIVNDHADATGASCLALQNDSTGAAINVVSGGIRSSASSLLLNDDAAQNIELFSVTDVADATDGADLRIHRKAAEGDSYIRIWTNQFQQNYIYGTDNLYLQAAGGTIRMVDNVDIQAKNLITDTTTGTKIGTATTQKLGFYNATPVDQPVAVADATGAGDVVAQFNALLARMRELGLIAT